MFNHDRGFLLLSEHSYTFMYLIKGVFSPTVKLCSSILSEIEMQRIMQFEIHLITNVNGEINDYVVAQTDIICLRSR